MKKIILVLPLAAFCFSKPALSSDSIELIMTDDELARVVCHHLEQTEEVKIAVSKAYSETKKIVDDHQKTVLKQLANGVINHNSFCSNIQS